MIQPPDIFIKNFSFQYEDVYGFSLRNINFEARAGEFVLLAGASGCGKSTLLRCLNGIIPHLLPGVIRGGIAVKGEDVSSMKPESIARHAGSVFQNPRSQFFHTNVLDEIAFGPENSGLSRPEIISRVGEAVELLGLDHLKDRKMYELSSGEQQKVSFAAIYASGKDILFLDEPSANLDAQAIGHLKDVLGRLKSKGKTILIAEHRLYYLAGLFDKMVVMEGGEIKKVVLPNDDLRVETLMKDGLRALDLGASLKTRGKTDAEAAKKTQKSNLEASGLLYRYPAQKTPALDGVSCSFSEGEILAVVGPNGSGKTTLIKLAAGLLSQKKGAFYDASGKRLSSGKRLQSCGMVLQESSAQLFYPTVREELASAGADVAEPHVMDFLEELGLSKFVECHPQQLSAGQQQRLAFALAAVKSPKILILDEPTSGLDARSMRAMGARIRKQAETGSTVIIVTHDIEFINEFCDNALVMAEGKLAGKIPRAAFPDYFRNGLLKPRPNAMLLPGGQPQPLAV